MNNEISHFTSKDLLNLINDESILLVDVRTKEEWKNGVIDSPNMIFVEYLQGEKRDINVNFFDELNKKIDKIITPKIEKLVFICAAGRRSLMALRGYKNKHDLDLINLNGGMNDWVNNGFKIKS